MKIDELLEEYKNKLSKSEMVSAMIGGRTTLFIILKLFEEPFKEKDDEFRIKTITNMIIEFDKIIKTMEVEK